MHDIQLSFIVAGHTRCLVDGCFGIKKQKHRQSDCNTSAQIQTVMEESASVNCAQLYQGPNSSQPAFKWYNWVSFFDRFKPLPGIHSLHHFRFRKGSPGTVFVKESASSQE